MTEGVVPVSSDAPRGRAAGCAESMGLVFVCEVFGVCRSSFCETVATLSVGFGAGLTRSSSPA